MKLPKTNWTDVVLADAVPLSEAVAIINSKCPGAGYTEIKLLEHAHNGQIVLFTRLVNVEATCPNRKIEAARILAEVLQGMATKSGADTFRTSYYTTLVDVIFPPPYLPNNHTDQWIKKIKNRISPLDLIDLTESISTLRNWADQITLNGHVAIPPVTSGEFLCEDVVKLTAVFSYDAGFTRNADGTKGHMDGSEYYWVNKTAKRESLRIDQRQINWIIEFLNQKSSKVVPTSKGKGPDKEEVLYLAKILNEWNSETPITWVAVRREAIARMKSGETTPFHFIDKDRTLIAQRNRDEEIAQKTFQNWLTEARKIPRES